MSTIDVVVVDEKFNGMMCKGVFAWGSDFLGTEKW
jgi:hypothetical protein